MLHRPVSSIIYMYMLHLFSVRNSNAVGNGGTAVTRLGGYVRSDADMEQILDGLHEQEVITSIAALS